MMMFTTNSWGQFTWNFQNAGTWNQDPSENNCVVLQQFESTNGTIYPDGRTITFKTIELSGTTPHAMMVTLLDINGIEILGVTKIYDFNGISSESMIPICATYHSGLQQYIVMGYARLPNRSFTWYALFDRDLNLLDMQRIRPTNATLGVRSNFVTSVTAIENNPPFAFAFCGRTNSSNTIYSTDASMDNNGHIFVAELNPIIGAPNVNFNELSLNSSTVFPDFDGCPVSIIEFPGGANGGYFICGQVRNQNPTGSNFLHYIRVDYGLNNYSQYFINDPAGNNTDYIVPQRIALDITGLTSIDIAGAIVDWTSNTKAFFFDRVDNTAIANTPTYFLNNSISANWFGALNPGLPLYVVNNLLPGPSGDVFPFVEGIYPVNGTNDQIIVGRIISAGIQNGLNGDLSANVPYYFRMNYSSTSFTSANWATLGLNALILYPRLYGNSTGTNPAGRLEMNFSNMLSSFQQTQPFNYGSTNNDFVSFSLGSVNPVPNFVENMVLIQNTVNVPNPCLETNDLIVPSQASMFLPPINLGTPNSFTVTTSSVFNGNINLDNENPAGCTGPWQWKGNNEGSSLLNPENEEKLHAEDGKITWNTKPEFVEILTLDGKLLKRLSDFELNSLSFGLSNLPSSIYIVRYKFAGAQIHTKKATN